MANRATHDVWGVGAGAIAAAWCARSQTPEHQILEVVGGCLGGWGGSRLPDVFDPPTCPNHRSWAHGVVPVGFVGSGISYLDLIAQLQGHLRAQADAVAAKRAELTTDVERLISIVIECLMRAAAGAVPGVVAGYASHLGLDAGTRKGLPPLG